MIDRIDEQLRRYGAFWDSTLRANDEFEAIAAAAIADGLRVAAEPPRSRRFRGWAPALAGAAAALVLVGGTVMVLRSRDETPVVATVPSTSTVPITTTLPPVSTSVVTTVPSVVPMAPLGWIEAPMSDDLVGAVASGVTVFDGLYLAVGGATSENGRSNPAVWTSADGLTWERVVSDALDTNPRPAATDDLFIADVATGPLGIIAVGGEGRVGSEEYDAAVWLSTDGSAWVRVEIDPEVLGGPGSQVLRHVVAGGPGWIALGDGGESSASTGIWLSADGVTWSRGNDAQIAPAGETVVLTDLVVRDDGLVVATGHVPAAGAKVEEWWLSNTYRAYRPIVVITNGYDFEQISLVRPTDIPGDGAAVLESVTVDAEGDFVILGKGADTMPAVWRSRDGREWTRIETTFEGLAESEWWVNDPHLPTITSWGAGLIAVGECEFGGCMFESTDGGVTWANVAEYDWRIPEADVDPEYFISAVNPSLQWPLYFADVAVADDSLLVVGTRVAEWNEADHWSAAAWVAWQSEG